MESSHWTGDDTREFGSGEPEQTATPPPDHDGGGQTPDQVFRRNYQYCQRRGEGPAFLAWGRAIPMFRAVVEAIEREAREP